MRKLTIGIALVVCVGFARAGQDSRNTLVDGKTLEHWVSVLKGKDRDPGLVEHAIHCVAQFGAYARSSAGPELVKLLVVRERDPATHDVAVRVNAALAIGEIGLDHDDLQRGLSGLVQCLRDDRQAVVRFHAIIALARLGNVAADSVPTVSVLLNALRDNSSWEIRRAAAYALARVTYKPKEPPIKQVVHGLATALGDHAALVRLESVMALARIGAPGSAATEFRQEEIAGLRRRIRVDHDKRVVIWSQAALVSLSLDPKPLPLIRAIAKELHSEDLQARIQAAMALSSVGQIQPDEVRQQIPAVIGLLQDPQEEAAGAASSVLRDLRDRLARQHVEQIAGLLRSPVAPVRGQAVRTLGYLGDKSADYVPAIAALLQDPSPSVVSAACLALGDLGNVAKPVAIPALTRLAQTGPVEVRATALATIRHLNRPAAGAAQKPVDKNPATP